MTTAELETLSTELDALAAEQQELQGYLVTQELPEDLARGFPGLKQCHGDDAFNSREQIGPRALWSTILSWAMIAVALGAALTWRGNTSATSPARAPARPAIRSVTP